MMCSYTLKNPYLFYRVELLKYCLLYISILYSSPAELLQAVVWAGCTIYDFMVQHSRLPAQLTRSCMSSGRRCLTCDTANPFLKAFRSSCTLSFRCFCELEHACSAQWWIQVITYGCTEVLLTLTLKISDCSSIALNQDPQAFSHAQAILGIGAPYCSPPPMGMESRLGTAGSTAANGVLISPRKTYGNKSWH